MSATLNFLPEEKRHEATRLLPYVMAVMVYLSALALMGSLLLHSGFGAWTESLSNRLTVQVTEEDPVKKAADITAVTGLLEKTPGIDGVRRLSDGELEALLEPWLGAGNVTADLPVPAILDVRVSRNLALDLAALRSQVDGISGKIQIDDHQQWLGRFLRLMDTVEYTALGILLLVVLATVCIVIFGTKAGLAEHREIIAILHHLGAHDSMIARAYQNRFLKYGLKGGIIGLLLAYVTLVSLIYLSREVATGLVDTPPIPMTEVALLLVVPVVAGGIAMVTARFTVLRHLGRMV